MHDEAFPAKEAGSQFALKGDTNFRSVGGTQEGVLLRDELAAHLAQIRRHDLAWVRRGEGDVLFAAALIDELRHEETLSGEDPFTGSQQLVHETADLWFHSMVMLSHLDIDIDTVLAELDRRLGLSGIDEKASRNS